MVNNTYVIYFNNHGGITILDKYKKSKSNRKNHQSKVNYLFNKYKLQYYFIVIIIVIIIL